MPDAYQYSAHAREETVHYLPFFAFVFAAVIADNRTTGEGGREREILSTDITLQHRINVNKCNTMSGNKDKDSFRMKADMFR